MDARGFLAASHFRWLGACVAVAMHATAAHATEGVPESMLLRQGRAPDANRARTAQAKADYREAVRLWYKVARRCEVVLANPAQCRTYWSSLAFAARFAHDDEMARIAARYVRQSTPKAQSVDYDDWWGLRAALLVRDPTLDLGRADAAIRKAIRDGEFNQWNGSARGAAERQEALGLVLIAQDKWAEGAAAYRTALRIMSDLRTAGGFQNDYYRDLLSRFAQLLEKHGDYAAAEPLWRAHLQPAGWSFRFMTLDALAANLAKQGRSAEANDVRRESLREQQKHYRPGHPTLIRRIAAFARERAAEPDGIEEASLLSRSATEQALRRLASYQRVDDEALREFSSFAGIFRLSTTTKWEIAHRTDR